LNIVMKTNYVFLAAVTAALFGVASVAAQVTIGGGDPPAAGAILDLNSAGGNKGGLVLTSVDIIDLYAIPVGFVGINDVVTANNTDVRKALIGATVFNTYHDYGWGVRVWNGEKWQSVGEPEIFVTPTVAAPTGLTSNYDLKFSAYNLGADVATLRRLYPELSPAKQQIKYLASCTVDEAVNVFGDLYQWGRARDDHEKRSSSTHTGPVADAYVDANGQPNNTSYGKGKFILNSNTTGTFDWRATPQHNLWGNGEEYSLVAGGSGQDDNNGGVLYNGKYYQNTDWEIPANNPCPSGWRVPTQDEYERLVNYNGNPSTSTGSDLSVAATGTATETRDAAAASADDNELYWIPISGGQVSATWTENTAGQLGGYALYTSAEWHKAIGSGGYFNPTGTGAVYTNKPLYAADAPEPLLFFPAAGRRSRSDGKLSYVGSRVYYWSSTVSSTKNDHAFETRLKSDEVSANVLSARALGMSIRCVKSE
jgi:uncharacterized protein (TIGR02145 family)